MPQVKIGRYSLHVPHGDAGRHGADTARPILEGDEYSLLPIRATGHWPHYILDVGANLGAFTVRAADLFPGCEIIAIEPTPETFSALQMNAAANHSLASIHLHNAAAIPAKRLGQEVRLGVYPIPGGNTVFYDDGPVWPEARTNLPLISVKTVTLPDLLDLHHFPRIDVLKIDTEGCEPDLLDDLAATGWLRRTRWIRGEWHGRETIARVAAALHPTHVPSVWGDGQNGPFMAHNRLDGP